MLEHKKQEKMFVMKRVDLKLHGHPPALLDAPEPRPGFVQRWVATSIQGKDTPDNVYKRMREGWEARPANTVKNQLFPTINHGQWEGCIGIEGMLLCEMPKEKHRQMKEYYGTKSRAKPITFWRS